MRLDIDHELIAAKCRIGSSAIYRRFRWYVVKATTPGVIERT
jgi:hypothetical protein